MKRLSPDNNYWHQRQHSYEVADSGTTTTTTTKQETSKHLIGSLSGHLPTFVTIENFRVASYTIDGEPYLCLPNLLQFIQQRYPIERAADIFEGTVSSFVPATPKQIEGFIRAGVLPSGAKSCPLVKRSEFDRICLALFDQCSKSTISSKSNDPLQISVDTNSATKEAGTSSYGISLEAIPSHKPKSAAPREPKRQAVRSNFEPSAELKFLQSGMRNSKRGAPTMISGSNLKNSLHTPKQPINVISDNLITQDPYSIGLNHRVDIVGGERPLETETQASILDLARAATSTLIVHVYHRCFGGKCNGRYYYPSSVCAKTIEPESIECASCHRKLTATGGALVWTPSSIAKGEGATPHDGNADDHDDDDHDEISPLHSPVPAAQSEVPITVAGVGGTITTVTSGKRKTAPLPRLVAKNGQVNLFLDNIDRRQYMRDLFTTMIDIKWRYNLMAAAFGFVFSWLFFACIWYLVLYFHNDLEHENDPGWSPCIVNVYSFPAALLFSIETQSTLGFGSRIISVECPGAILIFCSQLIFGVVVECLIVGMVFAKLSRPTKRSQTIMYSKYATVCLREGKMCLTFRVGDVRSKSHIIGATLRASLVSSKVTQEGEIIPFYHHKLRVKIDDCKDSLLLIWPVTIVHVIDESSPFYKLNADELINFKFEIITVLEGTVESTGQSIQVRSSYLPSEVKWGYRFEPIVSTHGYGRYAQTIIDYNKFNRIVEVPTPKCSPLEYYADQATIGLCNSTSVTSTTTGTERIAGDNCCPNGDNQQVPSPVVLV